MCLKSTISHAEKQFTLGWLDITRFSHITVYAETLEKRLSAKSSTTRGVGMRYYVQEFFIHLDRN